MEDSKPTVRLEQLASNVYATIVSRYVMPVVGVVLMSMVVYFGKDLIEEIKKLRWDVTETNASVAASAGEIKLIQQQILIRGNLRDGQIGVINDAIKDHEGRIRVLEKSK